MEYYINNRQFIKGLAVNTGTSQNPTFTTMCTASELAVNTGTSQNPTFTTMCTASELTFNTEFEEKTWYVFCDAIQRALKTGVAMSIEGTVKIDMNNSAIVALLGDVHTLISTGEIAQFSNQLMQFELLTGINNGVLEYTKYQVPVSFSLSDLGGPAEDEGDFGITINIIGKGTVVSS